MQVKTGRDWGEFWWKASIYSVIGVVLIGAAFNVVRERLICPSATERQYIEFVDETVIWFDATNTELETLFKDLERDPELFTDDSWRWLISHHAETLGRIGNEFPTAFPSSEETELLGEYEVGLRDYAYSASVHILQALETDDRDMLWEGNFQRIKAKASASLYIDETIALWPECSNPMAGSKNIPSRETYSSRLSKIFSVVGPPPSGKDQ
ncbi:MAG: hypothetical protein OXE05_00765 [Chloroflexi bacterium]|nr:hypothetical protein [Chloroflexota bacterium]